MAIDESLLNSILTEVERDVRTKNTAAESTACLQAQYKRISAANGKAYADVVWNIYSVARHVETTGKGDNKGRGNTTINNYGRKAMSDKAKRFWVGVLCLLVAFGLAAWGFAVGTLTPDQRQILLWAFPLASGFACGSFAGTISAKVQGFLPGLLITATGGFAVWFLTFFFLFPSPKTAGVVAPATSPATVTPSK